MHTRRELFKRGALAAGSVGLAGLVVAPEAGAMHGMFSDQLHLTGFGVRAGGAMTWEADEISGLVQCTIAQGSVVGSGVRDGLRRPNPNWSCNVSGAFKPGPAQASATAIATKADGSQEAYTWTQSVTLV
jgi:hypothetical protein